MMLAGSVPARHIRSMRRLLGIGVWLRLRLRLRMRIICAHE